MADPLTIREVVAHPLRATLPTVQVTSQGDWPSLEIVVVEIRTESGLTGIGEVLGRRGAVGYAAFIKDALAPKLVGRSAHDRRALWSAMRMTLTGRLGGMLVECIAGLDIALWDLAGQAVGQPIWRLLGGMGRRSIDAYASSINWADDARVEAEVASARAKGFRQIKVKIGRPAAARHCPREAGAAASGRRRAARRRHQLGL